MLTPDKIYVLNGVTVNEKIIPDGTRWKDASKAAQCGFSAGSLYKAQRNLTGNTGKVKFITIHNTDDIASAYDDGEQYTRATYNENMLSVRVHFYVDDTGAWQNLRAGTGMSSNDPVGSAEVGWHAGDGTTANGGNYTSIALEVIMNDTAEHDVAARDNAARLTAWLLDKHGLGIDAVVSHTYWVNKATGKTFADTDKQCCNRIANKKWCPAYIFASTNQQTALANWKSFKALVEKYMNTKICQTPLHSPSDNSGASDKSEVKDAIVKADDLVSIASEAVYYDGKTIPAWVKNKKWVVSSVSGDKAVIDKSDDGINAIKSPVNIKYLTVEQSSYTVNTEPYRVKVNVKALKIRKGAGADYPETGIINNGGIYTITAEADGDGANKWGKLKSGAGWIALDYTEKM